MPLESGSSRPVALVTGASGGIGLALAEVFAEHDFDLVVVARRKEALEALAARLGEEHGARVDVRAADLLAPGAPARLVADLEADGPPVDVLVNNAGTLAMGRFASLELDELQRLVQLNAVVLTELTHRLLQPMLARGAGRVLNVASTSAFQPVPTLALYAASKAFVLSLSESLSEELRGTGVTVTALCPGLTRTDMLERAGDEHELVRRMPGFLLSDVEQVAREGYAACMAGSAVVVPGVANRVGTSLAQLSPRWLVRGLGGFVGRRTT